MINRQLSIINVGGKLMATEARVAANRANAQKSTGPRTPEGKETASQNALKHGLFAREGVIRGEDQDEFEIHRERLLAQLNPVGPLEEILADRIVDLSWRLKRAVQDQSEAFAALYERQTAGTEEPGTADLLIGSSQESQSGDWRSRAEMISRMILEDFSGNAVLERLLRYERRIESSLYRTLTQLRRVHDQIQKAELEDPNLLDRWREVDGNARKARAFACCAPGEVSKEVSSEKSSFQCEVSSLKLKEAPSSPGSLPTSNFTLQPSGETPAAQSETCETKPNLEGLSSVKCQVSSGKSALSTSHLKLETAAEPPSESCKTKPMCAGGSSAPVGYTPVFRRRR